MHNKVLGASLRGGGGRWVYSESSLLLWLFISLWKLRCSTGYTYTSLNLLILEALLQCRKASWRKRGGGVGGGGTRRGREEGTPRSGSYVSSFSYLRCTSSIRWFYSLLTHLWLSSLWSLFCSQGYYSPCNVGDTLTFSHYTYLFLSAVKYIGTWTIRAAPILCKSEQMDLF